MLGPEVDLNPMGVPPIRIAVGQIDRWPFTVSIIRRKGRRQGMGRDGKVQMVEFAIGVAYLPCEDLVVVSALVIGNEIEWRRTANAVALITGDVKINLILSDKLHPIVAGDVDFSPSWGSSGRKGGVIEWKMIWWLFVLGRDHSMQLKNNEEGRYQPRAPAAGRLLHLCHSIVMDTRGLSQRI